MLVVLFYAIVAVFMGPAVHLKVDEDLFLSMAKSFHRGQGFMSEGALVNYDCVLYSMLISVCYYFYKPETILWSIRLVNVLVSASVVFPVYLIAKKLKLNDQNRWILVVFSVMMPDMIDVLYVMQENLLYPIAIWFFYFVFCDIGELSDRPSLRGVNRYLVLASIFGMLSYYTKTCALALVIAYVVMQVILLGISKKSLTRLSVIVAIDALMFGFLKFGVSAINGFRPAANHYASQITWIFPITWKTFLAAGIGVIVYLVFYFLCTGIIPVLIPACGIRELHEIDRKRVIFIYLSIILMILEIVGTIFLTEEHGHLIPHKFLYRYMFFFAIPLVVYMLRVWEMKKQNGSPENGYVVAPQGIIGSVITVAIGSLVYYFFMTGQTTTSIMDSHLNLLIENLGRVLGSLFIPCLVMAGVAVIGITCVITLKQNLPANLDRSKLFLKTAGVILTGFLLINVFQHPYYSNVICKGDDYRDEFIAIANKLSKDDFTVCVLTQERNYLSEVYGYLWQDYYWTNDADETIEAGAIVTKAGEYQNITGFSCIKSGNNMDLWMRNA